MLFSAVGETQETFRFLGMEEIFWSSGRKGQQEQEGALKSAGLLIRLLHGCPLGWPGRLWVH